MPLALLDSLTFKRCTIGYFHWIVEDRIVKVVRVCGETEDGCMVDWIFMPRCRVSTLVNKILLHKKKEKK